MAIVPGPECKTFGLKLVFVQRGIFWMGDRRRQRQVEISHDFYIGAYPVTYTGLAANTG
jgi:formylglycine-generating enzyme required for sulfatase activity